MRAEKNERVLVTTLTKRMAEDLPNISRKSACAAAICIPKSKRSTACKILRDLRRGEFDVLIGINLLREGLDLPEVSLVAILDADKEGFLRSTTSLIQTMGRCARHIEGRAILYADRCTDSMNAGHRRNQSPPRQAVRLQRGEQHHAAIHHQGRGHGARPHRRSRLRHRPARYAELDAAAANITKPKSNSPSSSSNSKPRCAKPPRNSNSKKPPSSAIASAP